MSKESYARGFCKAAEAAGVDPVALAKFAQSIVNGGAQAPLFGLWNSSKARKSEENKRREYPTGGRAPEGTPSAKSGIIPYLSYTGDVYPYDGINSTLDLSRQKEKIKDSNQNVKALMNVPWYKNWHDAHLAAIEEISKGTVPTSTTLSPFVQKALAERYHQLMNEFTNKVHRVEK